jgi:uracil-DNA glycosylase
VTLYQQHVETYRDCRGCELCRTRERVVFPRGSVPADVVFVGEAPGESENILGQPFVGPAGQLLDGIVAEALNGIPLCATCGSLRYKDSDWTCKNGHRRADGHGGRDVRTAFTNLVLCIPYSADGVGKAEEPDYDHVVACKTRLEQFLRIARPRIVVAVGACAKKWLKPERGNVALPAGAKLIDITHPAAILRMNVAQRGLARQRCVVQVRQAVEELESGPIPY